MPEQGLTRKQHYVPRMYLKRWQCENDKKLLVITKKGKSNSIKDVTVDDKLFYQNFCYDVPNPDGTLWTSNEVEKTLGEYESRHNKLLERILSSRIAAKGAFSVCTVCSALYDSRRTNAGFGMWQWARQHLFLE